MLDNFSSTNFKSNRRSLACHGFTLIELLMVTSIISLRIGLLLPALSKVPESVRLTVCLNNRHQIMLATSMYGDENNHAMPTLEPYGIGAFSSYNHRGRYSIDEALGKTKHVVRYPFDRPLNTFVHPNLPRGGTPGVGRSPGKMHRGLRRNDFTDKEKFNFPLFECPSDKDFTCPMDWLDDQVRPVTSAYYAVGTSYLFILVWLQYVSTEYRDFVRQSRNHTNLKTGSTTPGAAESVQFRFLARQSPATMAGYAQRPHHPHRPSPHCR